MEIPDSLVQRMIIQARDGARPKMELVLQTVEMAFERLGLSVRRLTEGPPAWIWEDLEATSAGFTKFFIVSTSSKEGLEGFPIFTVSQAYSVNFDTWITESGLILGPDADTIARSLSVAITQHMGAFAGVRYAARSIAANRSDPLAGMVCVSRLMEMDVPSVSDEDIDQTERELDAEAAARDMAN